MWQIEQLPAPRGYSLRGAWGTRSALPRSSSRGRARQIGHVPRSVALGDDRMDRTGPRLLHERLDERHARKYRTPPALRFGDLHDAPDTSKRARAPAPAEPRRASCPPASTKTNDGENELPSYASRERSYHARRKPVIDSEKHGPARSSRTTNRKSASPKSAATSLESWNDARDPDVAIARARVEPGVVTAALHVLEVDERYLIVTRHRPDGSRRASTRPTSGRATSSSSPQAARSGSKTPGEDDLVFYCVCTPRFEQHHYHDVEGPTSDERHPPM